MLLKKCSNSCVEEIGRVYARRLKSSKKTGRSVCGKLVIPSLV